MFMNGPWRPALLAISLLASACGNTPPANGGQDAATVVVPADASTPASLCGAAAPSCFGMPDYVLQCSEDGGWHAVKCDQGKICYQGGCQALTCVPGAKQCKDNGVRTCTTDGQGFSDPVACGAGTACEEGVCLAVVCTADAVRCGTSGPERCNATGTAWLPGAACTAGTTCVDGACLASVCKQGDKICGPSTLYVCDGANKWTGTPCPTGQPCITDRCVQCVSRDKCQAWETCTDGNCVATTPHITTASLPAGSVDAPYSATLVEDGGKASFTWSIAVGALPDGLTLTSAGAISGNPTVANTFNVTLKVVDALGASDQKAFSIEITPKGKLTITTRSLPDGTVDDVYTAPLAATGGQSPYAWMTLVGPLPGGVDLLSTGSLSGTPTTPGTFTMTFRVFDAFTPPNWADQQLTAKISIAPLNITSTGTIYNLLVTKIVVLPTLIQLVPYSTNLTAKGGLKPYTWTEQAAPPGASFFITKWGLPSGLTMKPDGTISGWVTDVSDATKVTFPAFLNLPSMTGYFDSVQVADSQATPFTDKAIILLPTVPLVP